MENAICHILSKTKKYSRIDKQHCPKYNALENCTLNAESEILVKSCSYIQQLLSNMISPKWAKNVFQSYLSICHEPRFQPNHEIHSRETTLINPVYDTADMLKMSMQTRSKRKTVKESGEYSIFLLR